MRHPGVDAYSEGLESLQRRLFGQVRSLILSAVPEVEETMKYRVPFYLYRGLFLYLSLHRKKRLVLGFCNGFMMADEAGMLRAEEGQTQVRHWVLEQDFDERLLLKYIHEAVLVNNHLFAQTKKKQRT